MLNASISAGEAPRLSDVLFERPCRSFGTMAAMPSNIEAIEASLLFSAGLAPYVALVGPSGWGKSHLLEAVAYRYALTSGTHVEVVPAVQFLASVTRSESPLPLMLDDAQEALGKSKLRMMLRLALERRVRGGRPVILAFTLPKVTRQLRSLLPSIHSWTLAAIDEPRCEERVPLIDQLGAAEGLALSPALVRIIARQMHGNGRTVSGALKRLRLSGPTWLDASDTFRACGMLDPFFADNGNWDLKHKIQKTAELSRTRFRLVSANDLALYAMLRVACLSEVEVARFLDIEPAEAYLRASRFHKDVEREPALAAYVYQFVGLVVESLASE